MCEIMEGQISWFDQGSACGKMSLDANLRDLPREQTSKPSSKSSAKSSAKKLPLFLSLKRGGLKPDASAEWVTAAAPFPSLGDYTMHSFGESPSEENASRLSQILEDSPPPKYCLSAKAVVGILRRANKRGKSLPVELRLALQNQSGVMTNSYGQTEIANAGEVLRTLWKEVGAQTFIEWAKRTYVLVSEKTLLLCGLCEQGDWRREDQVTCSYAKAEQSPCENCNPQCPVRYLWESGVYGSTPQGREPDEQFARKLGAFMQELSRQTAPKEVFMRCLRCASEGSQPMQQALASMEKEQSAWMGHSVHSDDTGDFRWNGDSAENYAE